MRQSTNPSLHHSITPLPMPLRPRFYSRPPRRPRLPAVPKSFWPLYESRLAYWKAHYRNTKDRHSRSKTRRRIVWHIHGHNADWKPSRPSVRLMADLADLHAHYTAISDWV